MPIRLELRELRHQGTVSAPGTRIPAPLLPCAGAAAPPHAACIQPSTAPDLLPLLCRCLKCSDGYGLTPKGKCITCKVPGPLGELEHMGPVACCLQACAGDLRRCRCCVLRLCAVAAPR